MPALISLSPRLADHTFPRDEYDLRLVANALGRLSELVEERTIEILRTEFFQMLLSEFKWDSNSGIKNQIYAHLNLWLLYGKVSGVEIDKANQTYKPHPIPDGCRTQHRLEEMWADELGRLVVLHDEHVHNSEYFIGVACEKAFAGECIGNYEPSDCARYFPLVGPDNCNCDLSNSQLSNAYEYQVPANYTQTEVSFEAAKKNCFILGALEVQNPKRGSHYKVKFPRRPWVLDPNNNPIPQKFLKELVAITGYRLNTIIYALREGKLPPFRPRFKF